MSRSEEGLFQALEEELKKAKEPVDCNTLFDRPKVRQHAQTVNRVSDYLGNMWRKGQVTRLPAPRLENTRARWLYVWKGKTPVKLEKGIDFDPAKGIKLVDRPQMEITDDGGVITIELPSLQLVIRPKR
jgi:hypothetical protein